jgi:GNAT superfamily N-acetyltransferase
MSEPSIVTQPEPPKAWIETVARGLRNYNIATCGITEFYPVVFLVKGAGEEVRGGLIGNVAGGWLHVGSLWVDHAWRGRGYGISLMAAAEQYAIKKQCVASFLQTGSYEARPLYEKLGYRVFGELNDHPVNGHRRYRMTKQPLRGIDARLREPSGGAKIVMEPYASLEVKELVIRGVDTQANAAIGLPEQIWAMAYFFLRDDEGEVVGGTTGDTWGQWLLVAQLWIDLPLRGNGYATRLMNAIERHAVGRGCRFSHLDTFNVRARPLYEKLGYQVFGTLENHPLGHTHYFMKKTIAK